MSCTTCDIHSYISSMNQTSLDKTKGSDTRRKQYSMVMPRHFSCLDGICGKGTYSIMLSPPKLKFATYVINYMQVAHLATKLTTWPGPVGGTACVFQIPNISGQRVRFSRNKVIPAIDFHTRDRGVFLNRGNMHTRTLNNTYELRTGSYCTL